jgi:O-antigen/teichoic acid export membrane protein
MDRTYRELLRHAGIFGAGTILFRVASIILFPVYTHYLTPADYGVIALLDLTVNLLAIVTSAGIASAATRIHFAAEEGVARDQVWWTAVLVEMLLAALVAAVAFAARGHLASLLFGSDVPRGDLYVGLALATLWIGAVAGVFDANFRARKASTLVVSIGLVKLLVSIVLNVSLLAIWRMGVAGILWGNLISASVVLAIQYRRFTLSHKRILVSWTLARGYWQFGWPLVVFGLFSTAMHEADRYVLRLFASLHDVGVYSVAYQIGQSVNTLITVPFTSIWSVVIYEVGKQPDARVVYARVFKYFVFGLSLVLLAASMFAHPILRVIAPAEYERAADIVPIVCLAYLFFSVHDHFKVPALLASRTVALLPAVIAAALINVALNVLIVPKAGATGAAWASVLTFALFSLIGLARNRQIDKYPYPFVTCSFVVIGMIASYVGYRALRETSGPTTIGLAAGICVAWTLLLFGGLIREQIARIYARATKTTSWDFEA